MESFWKEALKVTGSVAVIAFIFSLIIENLFEQEIIELFGSDRMFYLVLFILSIVAVALILALLIHGRKSKDASPESGDSSRSVSIEKSNLRGDVVLGDKTINQDRERDE